MGVFPLANYHADLLLKKVSYLNASCVFKYKTSPPICSGACVEVSFLSRWAPLQKIWVININSNWMYYLSFPQCLSLKWWITLTMKTLRNCVQSVGIKCLGTITDFSPVKAARFCTNYFIRTQVHQKSFKYEQKKMIIKENRHVIIWLISDMFLVTFM